MYSNDQNEHDNNSSIYQDTVTLYSRATEIRLWKERCFNALRHKQNNQELDFTQYQWTRAVSSYFIDIVNFPDQSKSILASLFRHLSNRLNVSTDVIKEIVTESSVNVAPPVLYEVPNPDVRFEGKLAIVSIGRITMSMNLDVYNTFSNDKLEFIRLVLRYSILSPSSGLFWSLDPEMYSGLSRSKYDVLECFASPFNYNIKHFCSVFGDDTELTYPDGVVCHGDFFSYIEELNDVYRLIVNPPYTDRVIDRTADAVAGYMARFPLAQFVAILPHWIPQNGITKMKEIQGSVSHVFEYGSFVLYNATSRKIFKPVNTTLIMIVNMCSDINQSTVAMNNIIQYMTRVSSMIDSSKDYAPRYGQ